MELRARVLQISSVMQLVTVPARDEAVECAPAYLRFVKLANAHRGCRSGRLVVQCNFLS